MPLATTPSSTPDGTVAMHRQLKIKVDAAKRLRKEHNLYREEAQAQEQKLSKLVDENAEEWELKHAKRIAEESQRMVKDTRDRLDKVVQELTSFVASIKNKPEFENDEELVKAEEALTAASV
ncbi:tubulin binding cofactor A [Pisolithus microcarpus]|nr:tubulin binding cofactor A [Pisolithus microcarpus]